MIKRIWTCSLLIALFIILETYTAFALQWPSPSSTVTAGYGWRIHPTEGVPRWHEGIDIRANYDQLKAVASGPIEWIRSGSGGGCARQQFMIPESEKMG